MPYTLFQDQWSDPAPRPLVVPYRMAGFLVAALLWVGIVIALI